MITWDNTRKWDPSMTDEKAEEALSYLRMNLSDLEESDFKEALENITTTFNCRLRKLRTYEEFEEFAKHVQSLGLFFQGIRNLSKVEKYVHCYRTTFPSMPSLMNIRDKNRVMFLFSGDFRPGETYVQNLHRTLEVTV